MTQNTSQNNLTQVKRDILAELKQRVEDKILEQNNYDLLEKLISKAENIAEAQAINALGTTYKKTGFHFDTRLEKIKGNCLHYLAKDSKLSFENNPDATTHTLIIGDNYPALLNLLISYREKIKVIYIDPPYGKDNLGEFAKTNYENAITRDNLLSMLKPRLEIAKMLLKDDGVIFCSIDDRNQAYLKCLFDDIFGERNYIETFLWNKTQTPPSASNKTRKTHEFILCYQKYKDNQKMIARFSEGDDAPLWNETNSERILTFPENYVFSNLKNGLYEKGVRDKIELLDNVEVYNGKILNSFRLKGHFRWKQETLNEEISNNVFLVVKSDRFSIRYCREGKRIVMPTNEISKRDGVGTNETASNELKKIFDNDKVFSFNKPISLIQYLVSLCSPAQTGGGQILRMS